MPAALTDTSQCQQRQRTAASSGTERGGGGECGAAVACYNDAEGPSGVLREYVDPAADLPAARATRGRRSLHSARVPSWASQQLGEGLKQRRQSPCKCRGELSSSIGWEESILIRSVGSPVHPKNGSVASTHELGTNGQAG